MAPPTPPERGVRSGHYPRWAVSMADLTLLLLGFAIMVHLAPARQSGALHAAPVASIAASSALFDEAAEPLFEQGEARLTPHARARLNEVGEASARTGEQLIVESIGAGQGAARFDRWELSAARAAAVARALGAAGVAQDHIDLVIPPLPRSEALQPQRIMIRKL